MDANQIINLAIPVFLILMAVEAIVAWRRTWSYYNLDDTLLNLSLGAGRQIVDIFTKVAFFGAYIAIHEHWRWFDLGTGQWWHWPLALVAVDFIYYWQHRWSHEVALLWAGHSVHHSSEEFNISVALRQSVVHDLMVYPMFFVLALLGLPPTEFFVAVAVLAIYQYWLHTRTIGRFPEWLERLINTPSNHRVHHGTNTDYIDRNYGGMLMVWDVLFGTYAAEHEPVRYGVLKPVRSWNPLWVNLTVFADLWQASLGSERWRDKVRVWFKPPGWTPSGGVATPPAQNPRSGHRFRTEVPGALRAYILIQYTGVALAVAPVLALNGDLPMWQNTLLLAFAFWGACTIGGLQQLRPWAWAAERARLVVFAGLAPAGLLLWAGAPVIAGAVTLAAMLLLSALWLRHLQGRVVTGANAQHAASFHTAT